MDERDPRRLVKLGLGGETHLSIPVYGRATSSITALGSPFSGDSPVEFYNSMYDYAKKHAAHDYLQFPKDHVEALIKTQKVLEDWQTWEALKQERLNIIPGPITFTIITNSFKQDILKAQLPKEEKMEFSLKNVGFQTMETKGESVIKVEGIEDVGSENNVTFFLVKKFLSRRENLKKWVPAFIYQKQNSKQVILYTAKDDEYPIYEKMFLEAATKTEEAAAKAAREAPKENVQHSYRPKALGAAELRKPLGNPTFSYKSIYQ